MKNKKYTFSILPLLIFSNALHAEQPEIALYALADTPSRSVSQRKPPSPQELTQLATDTMLRYFDQSIKDGLIGAENLARVLTHLCEKSKLINPISERERDQSTAHLLRYKTFHEIMMKVAKLHAMLDYAHIQNWLTDKIKILEENNRDRDRVHEETRELHRPMRFVPLPAGTYTDMIDHEEFTIPEGVEIQETPVTQFQWASVMGENLSTHTESSELTDFTEEITINNNFVQNKKVKMRADAPVETVSLEQIREFIKKLNADAQKKNQNYVYALPSVGEYQALLQTTLGTDWLDELKKLQASQDPNNLGQNTPNKHTHPVALGDYLELKQTHNRVWDVVGNVWQWTRDQWDPADTTAHIWRKIYNLIAPTHEHLVFGSSYINNKNLLDKPATLLRLIPFDNNRNKSIGFRLVRLSKDALHDTWEIKKYTKQMLYWDEQIVEDDNSWLWNAKEQSIRLIGLRHMIEHKELYPEEIKYTLEALLENVFESIEYPAEYLMECLRKRGFFALTRSQIQSLIPIAELIGIKDLRLFENRIQDLTPLIGLTQLSVLDLSYNQIQDLTPLAGLNQLSWLALQGNPIRDLKPLANFTQDLTLCLDSAQIEELKADETLPKNIHVLVQ